MAKARYSPTERIGVGEVGQIVQRDLGWIFREQSVADVGIDAHIEQVDGSGYPTGKLIGAQIKTGASHVRRVGDALVFYGKFEHLDYWLSHSLPVVFIVHIPGEGTYWQVVNTSTTQKTAKNWKIEIPLSNVLGTVTRPALEVLFQGTPQQRKQNRLEADERLMRYVADGGKVVVEMEDWVNKSLGRTPVNIYTVDEHGHDVLSKAYGIMYTGYTIKQVAQRLFPWARIRIDQEFYDENGPEETEEERFSRAQDADNGITYPELTPDDIRPYEETGGEVELYRLELTLNDVGKAYLTLADFLGVPDDTWARSGDSDDGDDDDTDLSVPE